MTRDHGTTSDATPRLRSRRWFDNPADPAMTALYVERYLNYGITREELQGGKPIIGIAQTGSDLSPCNRHHLDLATRVRDGIRDAGGIPLEFPVHPIQETGKRPTAALDRNLAYLGLVEILHGYPLDGVVLTTGCDKTTPACLMAAATVNIPVDRALGRADAGRVVAGAAVRLRHHRLGRPQALCRGQDRLRGIHGHGGLLGALGRPLQHHGHRHLDELAGRGAGHVAARLRRDPRPLPRTRPDGVRDRAADRADGAREPAPLRHHDQGRVRERGGRRRRARRLLQLPDPHGRDRAAHGRGPHAGGLAAAGPGGSPAGRLPARRPLPRRDASTAPAACPPCCANC